MTKDDIESTIHNVESKISNIKEMLSDFENCKNALSKAILLAAAGKLTSEFAALTTK